MEIQELRKYTQKSFMQVAKLTDESFDIHDSGGIIVGLPIRMSKYTSAWIGGYSEDIFDPPERIQVLLRFTGPQSQLPSLLHDLKLNESRLWVIVIQNRLYEEGEPKLPLDDAGIWDEVVTNCVEVISEANFAVRPIDLYAQAPSSLLFGIGLRFGSTLAKSYEIRILHFERESSTYKPVFSHKPNNSAKQVFISYKRIDEDFARKLRSSLIAWGFRTWLDVINISSSEIWDTKIHHGLKESDVVVGIITPESLRSDNVLDEWAFALETKRPLHLLLLRPVSKEAIPPRYIRIQRIDMTQDHNRGFEQLRLALENV